MQRKVDQGIADIAGMERLSADAAYQPKERRSKAVLLDLPLPPSDIGAAKAGLRKAWDDGKPVVITNGSATGLCDVLGMGLDARVAVVRRLSGTEFHVTRVPAPSELTIAIESEGETRYGIPPLESDEGEPASRDGEAAPVGSDFTLSVDAPTNAEILEVVKAVIESTDAPPLRSDAEQEVPEQAKRVWFVETKPYPTGTLKGWGRRQRWSIVVDAQISLYAANNPSNKFLVIDIVGAGVNPGKMLKNTSWNRRFFQEEVRHTHRPATESHYFVAPHGHEPETPVGKWTHNVTTGYSVTAGSDKKVAFTFNSSKRVTREWREIRVIDDSDDRRNRWRYRLGATDGVRYDSYRDLYKKWSVTRPLRRVPDIVKSNFLPESQSVWRADQGFDGTVTMDFVTEQKLRGVQVYEAVVGRFLRPRLFTNKSSSELKVDFSQVQPVR